MVKLGKLMKKGKDAALVARFTGKSSSPATVPAAPAVEEPAASEAVAAAPSVTEAPSTANKSRKSQSSKRSKSRSPVEGVDEIRDQAPPAAEPKFPFDQDDAEMSDADEPSDEESTDAGSATYDGTMDDTYDDLSERSTEDGEDTYDDTTNHDATTVTTAKSVPTVKGTDVSKKYFHKDVVLNSLEDGSNSLVIRAMYFIPKPKNDNHVVVKVEASTISARDCLKCKGHGVTKAMLPFVPGYEFVGTIQALGENVKSQGQFRDGDRVAGVSTFGGGNSRFISIPSDRLTKISANVKSTQAVCMIHDYMAALKALRLARRNGSPFTGQNILITDGFSPVGQAIIKLASMEGAEVYVCADETKHSYLASLGAKCFSKNPETWLPSATGTFDVVIDNSCIDSYSSSWFALNQKGTLVCVAPVYNIDNDDMPSGCTMIDVSELQMKWAALKAQFMTQTKFLDTVKTYDEDIEQYKQDLRYLLFLLETGGIKPKVAERVSLDDVPDAQRLMQSGRANGTVVCVPWIEE